jgi:branched-chain amino acid transport system ATP-binding protein
MGDGGEGEGKEAMRLLEVFDLTKNFGGITANSNVNLHLDEGEVLGLIGPNGAGKTTLFNCIAGYHKPDKGRVIFMGKDITGWPPHMTNREGIARTFQVTVATGEMTVEEEVLVGAFCKIEKRSEAMQKAAEIVEFMGLQDVRGKRSSELPVAMQKRVGMARAVATQPRLLMLDEVAAGLTPSELEEIKGLILRVRQKWGITIFLTEHVMELVMDISQRVIVLDGGVKIAEGTPDEVANNEEVIKAYLGERYAKGRGR